MSGAAPSVVLAVDVGSSRVRAALVDVADGTVLDLHAGAPLAFGAELDLAQLWRELVQAIRGLSRGRAEIRAIALSALLGMVLLDEHGHPTRPALTWMDARAGEQAVELAELITPAQQARTGRRISPELTAARLRWLRRHESGSLAASRWVASIKDALVARLTGAVITDETHASYSGLFDVYRRGWDADLAAAAGVEPSILPGTRPGGSIAGELSTAAAAELDLAAGLPCAVGGPDGTVGALGAGAFRAGITVDIAGTTDVLIHTVAAPVDDPDRRCILNAHLAPGLWTLGGPTGLTGGAIEWTARMLGYPSVTDARVALDDAALGPRLGDGPTVLPSLDGTRFPSWRPDQHGQIEGLRSDHGPADVFGGAQLGVTCVIDTGLEALRTLGLDTGPVVVAGGAARNPPTLQLRSDCWDVEVRTLVSHEATLIGTAMLAATAAGLFPDLSAAGRALLRRGPSYHPDRARTAAIAGARRRWRRAQRAACVSCIDTGDR